MVPNISLETVRSSTHLFAREFGWTVDAIAKVEWNVLSALMRDIEADYKKQAEQIKDARSQSGRRPSMPRLP